jgi:hypothetical protein
VVGSGDAPVVLLRVRIPRATSPSRGTAACGANSKPGKEIGASDRPTTHLPSCRVVCRDSELRTVVQ